MYGPWLLVSYGRQGNRNYKGRTGRADNGNTGSAEKNRLSGKLSGNRHPNVRRFDNDFTEVNTSKPNYLRTGLKGKTPATGKLINADRPSGSKFDVLSEDMDVMAVDGNDKGIKKVDGGSKPREQHGQTKKEKRRKTKKPIEKIRDPDLSNVLDFSIFIL
ncbi:hypothetical protein LWI29_035633 [Acer saccharum]|uniref:Uncharacterized protein n=1 Tax=Acer saccharum TaxID=4024 RepID=A0AA39VNG3_ACESA|nr:hypothetical protein LWI29_035633 [Acer saccharum]